LHIIAAKIKKISQKMNTEQLLNVNKKISYITWQLFDTFWLVPDFENNSLKQKYKTKNNSNSKQSFIKHNNWQKWQIASVTLKHLP